MRPWARCSDTASLRKLWQCSSLFSVLCYPGTLYCARVNRAGPESATRAPAASAILNNSKQGARNNSRSNFQSLSASLAYFWAGYKLFFCRFSVLLLRIRQAVENIGDVSDVQLAINWLLDHGALAWAIKYGMAHDRLSFSHERICSRL